jgi:pimeloyl-ACP methyl ester carboxylesterase
MSHDASPQADKGTNVRSTTDPLAAAPATPAQPGGPGPAGGGRKPRAPSAAEAAVRAGLRVLSETWPAAGAVISAKLMFRTHRRTLRAAERDLLATAQAFDVHSRAGKVRAYAWGTGPTVVLVHGWNGHAAQLGPMVGPLLEAGYRVVSFDAPGHGASPGSESSMVHFADALDAVLDEVRPPFGLVHAVVAHSMGGAATTFAMGRRQRAPNAGLERALRETNLPVRRFVFVAPPIDARDFVRGFVRRTGIGVTASGALSAHIEARFGVALADLDALRIAPSLNAPLLVVHDEEDREVPLRCGQALADAWPGSNLEVTRGLGHTRILRDPVVVQRIADFVAEEMPDTLRQGLPALLSRHVDAA